MRSASRPGGPAGQIEEPSTLRPVSRRGALQDCDKSPVRGHHVDLPAPTIRLRYGACSFVLHSRIQCFLRRPPANIKHSQAPNVGRIRQNRLHKGIKQTTFHMSNFGYSVLLPACTLQSFESPVPRHGQGRSTAPPDCPCPVCNATPVPSAVR
jgi:hypothetical protein